MSNRKTPTCLWGGSDAKDIGSWMLWSYSMAYRKLMEGWSQKTLLWLGYWKRKDEKSRPRTRPSACNHKCQLPDSIFTSSSSFSIYFLSWFGGRRRDGELRQYEVVWFSKRTLRYLLFAKLSTFENSIERSRLSSFLKSWIMMKWLKLYTSSAFPISIT